MFPVSLPPPPSADGGDWSAEILDEVRQEFNGELTLLDPSVAVPVGDPYDPETGLGGETTFATVIAARPGRAQQFQLPLERAASGQWITKRRYRFQCEIKADDPLIEKGMLLKWSGGKDPVLSKLTFTVLAATNSSHAALRTILCSTEGDDV
ncbi:DUF6093 family protein [Agromyces larvae]|uniref:DUF6093 family protein n=1 Tax=Agromyces larvae TaxID=2929802 RepID=A0ABY4C712_9MICO|nr:DUF6093 family protein [Agromyces larvae]UOE45881.1 DUF6093 family protein [Agromyces larvae]